MGLQKQLYKTFLISCNIYWRHWFALVMKDSTTIQATIADLRTVVIYQ